MRTIIQLPIAETFGKAWRKVSGVKLPFFLAGLTTFVIIIFFQLLEGAAEHASNTQAGSIMYLGISIINTFLQTLLVGGLAYMGAQRAFDRPVVYKQLWRGFKSNIALNLFALMLLQIAFGITLGVLGSINIALAILGLVVFIYLMVRFFLTLLFIMDKEVNLFQALKLSWQASQMNFWRLLGWMLLTTIIYVISALPLLIGLIWTLPWLNTSYGEVYKTLMANTELQPIDPNAKPKLSDLV